MVIATDWHMFAIFMMKYINEFKYIFIIYIVLNSKYILICYFIVG